MLGKASEIGVKVFESGLRLQQDINEWLTENPDTYVIDIKFSSSATNDEWGTEALIIYKTK
jgi:hypothetical protein